ncbi:MAG: hypothetical protein AB7J73_17345 [Gammaproteobacteria bacterium]
MGELLQEHWFLIIFIAIGALQLYRIFGVVSGTGDAEARKRDGKAIFGPFWPTLSRYLEGRGPITKRERYALVALTSMTIIAIVFVLR